MYVNPQWEARWQEEFKASYSARSLKERALQVDPDTGLVLRYGWRTSYKRKSSGRGPSWEAFDGPDNAVPDGMVADRAVAALGRLKDKRFFLAVGFLKPHLPFVAPKRFFDLYPLEKLRPAANPHPPKDVPPVAMTNSGELRSYTDIPRSGPVSDQKALELIRGYYAATSFADEQLGRVLDELDRLGLREKTVIVFWGDHGWHLGENGLWCKQTNFELATRSPLIFCAPGQKNAGAKTDSLAEFVDIYPTLCDLCGLPIPEGLEGTSQVPAMDDPNRSCKEAALSQYPRRGAMGRYPLRFGIDGHFPVRNLNEYLRTDVVTLPKLLRKAGYATVHVGKWHLGGMTKQLALERAAGSVRVPGPHQHGFDYYLSFREEHEHVPRLKREARLYRDGAEYLIRNDRLVEPSDRYLTDYLTDEAVRLLEQRHKEEGPFFLNLCFYVPHFPFEQACLGWWMAYLACRTVNDTEDEYRHLTFTPLAMNDTVGIGAVYQR